MARPDDSVSLSALARLGFAELSEAAASLSELASILDQPRTVLLEAADAADPDAAVRGLLRVARRDEAPLRRLLVDEETRRRVWRVFGASEGLADFFLRHPDQLTVLEGPLTALPSSDELRERLLASVGAHDGFAQSSGDEAVVAIRVAYRRNLAAIAAYDLSHPAPETIIAPVSAALADIAGAALEASLAVARTRLRDSMGPAEVAATRLAVIGMGKAGARELNYVSDVDVIFVGGSNDEEVVTEARAIDIATRLARETMRNLDAIEVEPPLWEVDAALRPEGKQGALVRSLASHLAYYDRWAKSWEFQALLKARPLAGDAELGAEYIAAVQPKIWSSAARQDFVESVQRMRERVMEHIDPEDAPYQLKLGAGGLRDIEFTVQLLQLVHGLTDESLRTRGTLESLDALVEGGYIGRVDAAAFADDYRLLRLMEHRLQLRELSRTHLMPRTPAGLRPWRGAPDSPRAVSGCGRAGRACDARCVRSTPACSTVRC